MVSDSGSDCDCDSDCDSKSIQQPRYILKVYDTVPRWTCAGHSTAEEIFVNESRILEQLYPVCHNTTTNSSCQEPIINYNLRHILMPYAGPSLYDCPAALPENWQTQLDGIFLWLSTAGIRYPEFNLANICVSEDGQMSFIDFGLAKLELEMSVDANNLNKENCEVFTNLLSELMPRLQKETNLDEQHRLYHAFIRNKRSAQTAAGANRNIF